MKKILAILLTMLMAFTVAISVSAADADVAAIDETTYATLADAIAAAAAGDTITLLDNVTEDVTVNKNITLDGADKQYTGTLSIAGGKKFIAENVNFINGFILADTKNTNNSVSVKNCNFEGEGSYKINMNSGSNLTIENCNAKNIGQGLAYTRNSVTNIAFTNVNIDGGTYGINTVNNTTMTFENVIMKNVTRGLQLQTNGSKTVTFKNCKIEATDTAVYVSSKGGKMQTLIFEGENEFGTNDYTFGSDLVNAIYDVAVIGDEKFKTINEAVAAAADGDTVTVIADHEIASEAAYFGTVYTNYYVFTEVADKKVTIDLNGKVVTINPDLDKMMLAVFFSTKDGEITFKDSSEAKTGAINVNASEDTSVYSMFTADEGGKLNIESGNYYLNKVDVSEKAPRALIYSGDNKHVTVSGGNFVLGNAHTATTKVGNYDVAHPWIFNAYGDGVRVITVTGGTYNVDPTHYHGEAYYPDCYKAVEEDSRFAVKVVHTPGDAATCKTAQLCTVCSIELDAIKDCTFENYVSNNDYTCKADGTKTAECIYGCGATDTVADVGTKGTHNDVNGDGYCNGCNAKFCPFCGEIHGKIQYIFCIIEDLINTLSKLFAELFK